MNYAVQYIIESSFGRIGLDCMISPLAVIRNPENIQMGDNVRIDEYAIVDGGAGLRIGSHTHISTRCTIYSGAGVEIGDFSTLAPYVYVMSETDDYSGRSLVGPQFKASLFKHGYISRPVVLKNYVNIGTRSTIFPGVTLAEGTAIGAHSLVKKSITKDWSIYCGAPAKYLKPRSRDMVCISEDYLDWYRNRGVL